MGEGDRISMSHRARSGSLGILNIRVSDQAGQRRTPLLPLASAHCGKCPGPLALAPALLFLAPGLSSTLPLSELVPRHTWEFKSLKGIWECGQRNLLLPEAPCVGS